MVKLPLTLDGLKACRHFSTIGIKTNVTLCLSASQAFLAAKAGATCFSPFVGRLDDINNDGMNLIRAIRQIFGTYEFGTQILAASSRNANHVKDAARAGADAATIPATIIKGLAAHVLIEKGLEQFGRDWAASGQSIL